MIQKSKVLGLIPARGGSKGVINKNIREINNKPLIAYTIESALAATSLDRVIVSTDNKHIADVALQYGAEVPFMRPSELAQDNSGDREVILHAIEWLKINESDKFDLIAYLRPTTPLRTAALIDLAVAEIKSDKSCTGLRSLSAVNGIDHPYWMYRNEQGYLRSFVPGIKINDYYQRQLLPSCYQLNGLIDIAKVEIVKVNNSIYGKNIRSFITARDMCLDIDDEHDLLFFNFILNQRKFQHI